MKEDWFDSSVGEQVSTSMTKSLSGFTAFPTAFNRITAYFWRFLNYPRKTEVASTLYSVPL
jgi:hypothetical protein